MKFCLDWHKECLSNSTKRLENKKKEVLRLKEEIERWEKNNNFYKMQVEEAEKRGMDGFDAEKFLIKKKPIADNYSK